MTHALRFALASAAALLAACGTVNTPEDLGPDAGPAELCTSATTALGDEDADGAIDEGCSWKFSPPHWMPATLGTPWAGGRILPAAITLDGKELALTVSETEGAQQQVWSTRRTATGFDAATLIPSVDFGSYTITGFAVSADRGTAYLSARPWPGAAGTDDDDTDLYVSKWDGARKAFGALKPLTALSDAGLSEERPFLRADGKELIFARGHSLFHAYADAQGDFPNPRLVTGVLDGDIGGPQLSADGRTLFYFYSSRGSSATLYRAERGDPTGDAFVASAQISDLGRVPDGFFPVLSESTRELFFASGSTRSWGPNTYSLWRARICRDGAACDLPQVACPSGVRSDDGTHCYTGVDGPLSRVDARAHCQALGGDLVSIQSNDEQTFVWTKFGDRNRWIGAFDGRDGVAECSRKGMQPTDPLRCAFAWETGEAPTFDDWAPGEPSDLGDVNEDCVILWYDDPEHTLHHGVWNDVSCGFSYPSVCESVVFPTW